MRKHIQTIPLIFLLLLLAGLTNRTSAQSAEKTEETVISALKAGDAQPIAGCLNDLCDLDLPQYKGTYSKAQAGRIISDFFRDAGLSGFKLLRQGQLGNKERYTMAEMKSGAQATSNTGFR
jgi:hypothetical protein